MADCHYYEPSQGHGLKHDPFNAIVGPRPIGWIASKSNKGDVNLAPYSFFNAFCYAPPIVGFSSTTWKDSIANIQETGEFTWNLVTRHVAEQMNMTAANVARDVDEFALAGLTKAPSRHVDVPRVGESLVSFECKLTQMFQLERADGEKSEAWMTFGEVIAVYIDKSVIKDGLYLTAEADPILRAGYQGDYAGIRRDLMFEMIRPK